MFWDLLKGPHNPYFKKVCEQNNPSRIKETISIFEMLIDYIKTSDEFEDEPSGTTLRALKTLTSKNLVNTITP